MRRVRSEGQLCVVSMGGSEKMTTINGQRRSINFLEKVQGRPAAAFPNEWHVVTIRLSLKELGL